MSYLEKDAELFNNELEDCDEWKADLYSIAISLKRIADKLELAKKQLDAEQYAKFLELGK